MCVKMYIQVCLWQHFYLIVENQKQPKWHSKRESLHKLQNTHNVDYQGAILKNELDLDVFNGEMCY